MAIYAVMFLLSTPALGHNLEVAFDRRVSQLSEMFWKALEWFVVQIVHFLLVLFQGPFSFLGGHAYARCTFEQASMIQSCVGLKYTAVIGISLPQRN